MTRELTERATADGVASGRLEWRIEAQNRRHHLGVAVEGGPVQRRRAMLPCRVHGPATFQHEPHRIALIVPGSMRHLSPITF